MKSLLAFLLALPEPADEEDRRDLFGLVPREVERFTVLIAYLEKTRSLPERSLKRIKAVKFSSQNELSTCNGS